MDAEDRTAIEKALKALREMRACQDIDSSIYHKCLVALAYEYAASDDLDACVGLLLSVPLSYYESEQLGQMQDDPDYASCCRYLGEKLSLHGYLEDQVLTMPTARA